MERDQMFSMASAWIANSRADLVRLEIRILLMIVSARNRLVSVSPTAGAIVTNVNCAYSVAVTIGPEFVTGASAPPADTRLGVAQETPSCPYAKHL